jgi:glutathione S-transferase
MHDVTLHHYPRSLFAEKIRRVLAYKGIPWRSVEQPIMAPKPDLTPLTGGYRRIPVLQIGADVYCDTACIARRLERLRSDPAVLPPETAGAASVIEDWADHRFFSQVTPSVVLALLPVLPPDILKDRAAMSPMMTREMLERSAPHAWSQCLLSLDRLEQQLRERPFLLGESFTLADAACFHPVWFLKQSPALFAAVTTRVALSGWFRRIEGFGAGEVKPMTAAEALAVARDAEPSDVAMDELAPWPGLSVGDAVAITADDYGPEASRGTIARWTPLEITIRRRDPALGEIAVHFPRAGYRVQKA